MLLTIAITLLIGLSAEIIAQFPTGQVLLAGKGGNQ
jgi:hypothetical protein